MLTLLEVRQTITPADLLENPVIQLARLDLTENTEAERQEALANARILYGPDCKYYWHDCGHDKNGLCTSREAYLFSN